ncbi:MAG: DUF2283 domain-containing protein [Acidimicrobiales bacterium]
MSTDSGPITIGGVSFDRVRYDRGADVLYLHVGDPSSAVGFDESPEGHHLRFDSGGRVVGITIVGVRRDLEAGRSVSVTLPERVEVEPGQLREVLSAA